MFSVGNDTHNVVRLQMWEEVIAMNCMSVMQLSCVSWAFVQEICAWPIQTGMYCQWLSVSCVKCAECTGAN